MKKKKIKNKASASGIISSVSFGVIMSVALLLSLLLVFSALALTLEKPHVILTPLAFFSIYTSAFFGGFLSAKRSKGRDSLLCGIICGIISAILLSLLFGIISLALNTESAPISWLYRALIIPASILGALIGAKSKPRKKRRRS